MCTAGRPQLAEVIKSVIPQHTTQWKYIGSKLNLPNDSLRTMESGYPTNAEMCCVKMLQKWLEVDSEASYDQLHMAISSLLNDTLSGRHLYALLRMSINQIISLTYYLFELTTIIGSILYCKKW